MTTEEKLDEILKWVQDLKDEVDIFLGNTTNGYTDRQLYDMRKILKWDQLSEATGIPRSTLVYRVNKYKELIGKADKEMNNK
jgi:hypothetical protein